MPQSLVLVRKMGGSASYTQCMFSRKNPRQRANQIISGPDPSADGNKRDQQDNKGAEMADEEEGSGVDSDWNTPPHLHPPKKRSLCRAATKPCIKRRRFSSQPSSDEESETGDESDYGSYIPSQTHHILKPQHPSHLTSLRSDTSDRAMDLAGGRSRTAVIYEQRSWEGEIVQERYIK